jgi:choline-sulfatase
MVDSVMNQLALSGRLANTYVVVTSDHGIQFGEHRLFLRKGTLYEESVRVAAAVRGPGIPQRAFRHHLVQLADLVPTVLDWVGQPFALPTDGTSWTTILANPMAPWRTEILFENLAPSPSNETADGLRDDQWSYHEYANGDRALYDMTADPRQTTNLASLPQYAATVAGLSARLAVLRTR